MGYFNSSDTGWLAHASLPGACPVPAPVQVPPRTWPLSPLRTHPSLALHPTITSRHTLHPIPRLPLASSPDPQRRMAQHTLRNWLSGKHELEGHRLVGRLISPRMLRPIDLFLRSYPPSPKHLVAGLAMLRRHDISSPSVPVAPKVTLDRAPTLLVLHEPSTYFLPEQGQ